MRAVILIAALLFARCVWAGMSLPALKDLAHGHARVSALVVNLKTHKTLTKLTP